MPVSVSSTGFHPAGGDQPDQVKPSVLSMPMSLPEEVVPDTVVLPASNSRMPQDCTWVKPLGPQSPLVSSHSFPVTDDLVIAAVALSLTWIPFWAIEGVCPVPVTVAPVIVALLLAPSTVIPFFW